MTAEVHQLFASEAEVDQAWESYRLLAACLPGHPELLSDRDFMEELKRAEAKWTKLFARQEAGA